MATVTVPLVGTLDDVGLCKVVQRFVNDLGGSKPETVRIDFNRLSFIRPSGVTFLSNFIAWLRDAGAEVNFVGTERYSSAIRYLDDSLFFQQHMGERIKTGSCPRSTTLPLEHIHTSRGFDWLRTRLIPWLVPTLNMTKSSLAPFQNCVAELFHNIQDHSKQQIGCIFVQHYPKEKEVGISIADFGRGIPSSVRTVEPNLDDDQAIVQAVKEGFTIKSSPNNRGVGLEYLMNTVVRHNGGRVVIHSLRGHVRFSRTRNDVHAEPLSITGYCPGTTIDIVFKTDSIVHEPDEPEELIW